MSTGATTLNCLQLPVGCADTYKCSERQHKGLVGVVMWTHCVRVCACDREGGSEGATEY